MTVIPGTPPVIGVIGGSGVYEIDGLENSMGTRRHALWGGLR